MDSWDVEPLEISDFPETSKDNDDEEGSAEIEKGRQTFVHMVSLTQIVAEILDQFFTLKSVRRKEKLPGVLERAKPIQARLEDWFSSLPKILSVDEIKPRRLSSGYLHLAYHTAEITLHRAIIRSHTIPNPNSDLILTTRHAAGTRFIKALDFVQRLRQEHLQSFWHFSSSISLAIIGIFAGVLAVTSADSDERESYVSMLAEYRWILRVSNSGTSVVKYAVGVLDKTSQLLEQQMGDVDLRKELKTQENEVSPLGYGWINSLEERELNEADTQQVAYNQDLGALSMYNIDELFMFRDTEL